MSRVAGPDEEAGMGGTAGGLVVLAVDDEEPALDELAHLLAADPAVDTVLRTTDAAEALRLVARSGVDAVYADLRMPGLDGMELARRCAKRTAAPAIVFVTAQETKAVDAFEVGAVDYLLKPVRSERLGASLRRVRTSRPATPQSDEVIAVELGGSTTLVPRNDVRWVEAKGDYARLHTDTGSHLVRVPLSVLEQRWADTDFLRVHRSYMVSRSVVRALRSLGDGYVLEIGHRDGVVRVPVSRRQTARVRRWLRGEDVRGPG
jgi:DNA-binding LytR/AlgR family response regulator